MSRRDLSGSRRLTVGRRTHGPRTAREREQIEKSGCNVKLRVIQLKPDL